MKKYFSILLCLLLCHCFDNSSPASTENSDLSQVTFSLFKQGIFKSAPQISNFHLDVSGQGGYIWSVSDTLSSSSIRIPSMPPGNNLTFNLQLLDTSLRVLYTCQILHVNLTPGQNTLPPLTCTALFSELSATIPLSKAPFNEVDSGTLSISDSTGHRYQSSMLLSGRTGSFLLGGLPGNQNYRVKLSLYKSNNLLFQNDTSSFFYITGGQSHTLPLQLHQTTSETEFTLTFAQNPTVNLNISWSGAKRRSPIASDIRITEIFPSPSAFQGNSDGEWLEISNLTLDTLLLSGCQIARTRGSTATTTRQILDSIGVLLPSQILVLGKDSVAFRNFPLSLQLVDTRQTLVLSCGSSSTVPAIDSIAYSSTSNADSILVGLGIGGQLDISHLHETNTTPYWCTTREIADSTHTATSPGKWGSCD